MEIHRASPGDAPRLKEIIVASKAHWGYADDWMHRWADRVVLTSEDVRDSETFVAAEDGEIAGFYLLTPRGEVCILDHLWILPERIGTGLGRALFTHALGRSKELGARRMEFECDPHAVGFYRHMGARHARDVSTELEGMLPVMAIDTGTSAADEVNSSPG